MATLHVMYDLDRNTFVGASVEGKFLYGVGAVLLGKDGAKVLDVNGTHLLDASRANVGSTPTQSRAAADIAQYFGAGTGKDPATEREEEELVSFEDLARSRS